MRKVLIPTAYICLCTMKIWQQKKILTMRITNTICVCSLLVLLSIACSKPNVPYEIIDGHTFVQKNERRNDSTEWKLVWEDEFDRKSLDTTHWSKIGLYTSERLLTNFPNVKNDKNAWKEIVNHWSSYASATNPEAVKLLNGNILLRGVHNKDTTGWDNRPYHTGGIWTLNKFAFQYGRIEIKAKLDPAYGAWPALWMIPEKKINAALTS